MSNYIFVQAFLHLPCWDRALGALSFVTTQLTKQRTCAAAMPLMVYQEIQLPQERIQSCQGGGVSLKTSELPHIFKRHNLGWWKGTHLKSLKWSEFWFYY